MSGPRIRLNANTLEIDGKLLDLGVFYAILDTDPQKRVLWQFREVNGKIQALPFTEREVIWIDKPGEKP